MAARRNMAASTPRVVQLAPPAQAAALPAVTLGWVVDAGPAGPHIDYPGNPHGPTPARLLVALTTATIQAAAEARVDGKRVVITGEEEVELRCGEASIVLSKSGKLVIRGAYVETRAKGTNRIKGGSVQIN